MGNVFAEGIRLLAAERVDLKPLVSRVFPLAEAPQALVMASQRDNVLKIQLDMT